MVWQHCPAHAGKRRPIRFVEISSPPDGFAAASLIKSRIILRAGLALARDQFPCARETLALWAYLASGDFLALLHTAPATDATLLDLQITIISRLGRQSHILNGERFNGGAKGDRGICAPGFGNYCGR
jgi:hypothetical protein